MAELLNLLPIVSLFVLGIILKHRNAFTRRMADRLLSIVVNIGLPLVIVAALHNFALSGSLLYLPLFAVLTNSVVGIAAWRIGRRWLRSRAQLGVFIIGPMIMNLAFVYPFVSVFLGSKGIAYLALIDLGNAITAIVVTYAIAAHFGSNHATAGHLFGRLVSFPPLLALVLALLMNSMSITIPEQINDVLLDIGRAILLLVPLAIGGLLRLQNLGQPSAVASVALRMFGGLVLVLPFIILLRNDATMVLVLLLAAIAPIGFNTVIYANREKLDVEQAAAAVSLSMIIFMAVVSVAVLIVNTR